MDLFLGPNRERWAPDSWQQLIDAAADGTLNETQWVELKKDLPPNAANSNLELARDLAGLALEGGLLVVGVSERKGPGGVASRTRSSGSRTRVGSLTAYGRWH